MKNLQKGRLPQRFPHSRLLSDDLGNWWVMHAKPNCESKIATYFLNREISYYLPVCRHRETVGQLRRTRIKEVPLFRGYICFALERTRHHLLYDVKKVVRIIEVKNQDQFVQELEAVSKALTNSEDLTLRAGIVPGKKVVVQSGPMHGVQGVLIQRRATKQLALSVEMFNQTIMVSLNPYTEIAPL